MSAVGSRGRTIFVADATSRRFALAANYLDRLARFFQNSMPSNGSRIRRRTFPRELAIELGKRSAGSGMHPTKTLAALVKAGLDKKTREKVTKNEKELAVLIRRATDSFWQHEAAIDWQNGSFPEIVRKTYITAFIKGALEGRNEGGS